MKDDKPKPEDELLRLLALEQLLQLEQQKELLVDQINSGDISRKDAAYVSFWEQINDINSVIKDILKTYGFN